MHGGDELPLVGEMTKLRDALEMMTVKRFGCVGVTDGKGKLVGIFTDGDLRRSVERMTADSKIVELMTLFPKYIAPSDLAAQALAIMNRHNINVLFVIEPSDQSKRPVGILHLHDCLRAGVQ